MIDHIKCHYTERGYIVNKEFLINFYLTNYSTSIWHEALNNSLLESNYSAIMDLEEEDWENADLIGSDIGNHVVDLLLKNS